MPYHSDVKEKEYDESLRSKYPHPSSQRQLAESLIKQEGLSSYVSLVKSVANVTPSLSELEISLSKLPYSLLKDIDKYGFNGDNIDNQILAYLELLDPSNIGDLQEAASSKNRVQAMTPIMTIIFSHNE
ncbi:hypothetical protein VIBNIFTn2_120244 [Vibrio nigripulchritudo FTn2]|nr:hypothetical protein VIBNIFTn2_120244 [Vibrio nigripulchritudo FTn2]